MLARVQIDHEINQSSLQSRARAGETDKTAATQLCGAFHVEKIQFCGEPNVIYGIYQLRLLSPGPHQTVRSRIFSDGNAFVWQVRDPKQQIVLFLLSGGHPRIQLSNLFTKSTDALLEFLCRFSPRLFAADFFAETFSISIYLLQGGFILPPLHVEAQYVFDLAL